MGNAYVTFLYVLLYSLQESYYEEWYYETIIGLKIDLFDDNYDCFKSCGLKILFIFVTNCAHLMARSRWTFIMV